MTSAFTEKPGNRGTCGTGEPPASDALFWPFDQAQTRANAWFPGSPRFLGSTTSPVFHRAHPEWQTGWETEPLDGEPHAF